VSPLLDLPLRKGEKGIGNVVIPRFSFGQSFRELLLISCSYRENVQNVDFSHPQESGFDTDFPKPYIRSNF